LRFSNERNFFHPEVPPEQIISREGVSRRDVLERTSRLAIFEEKKKKKKKKNFTRRYRPNRLFHARASVDGTCSNARRDLRFSNERNFFTRRYRPNRLFHARASVDGTCSNVRRDVRFSTKFFSSGGTARTDVSLAPLASELARNGNFTRGRQSTGRTRTHVETCDFRKKEIFSPGGTARTDYFTRRRRSTGCTRTHVETCDFRQNFSPGAQCGQTRNRVSKVFRAFES
jgi:hypothetical protein